MYILTAGVCLVTAGHLEMVKFLLEAGADQEHKTDEMHTALMEASMDGHVEVARLLLDHGAQVMEHNVKCYLLLLYYNNLKLFCRKKLI